MEPMATCPTLADSGSTGDTDTRKNAAALRAMTVTSILKNCFIS